MCPVWLTLERLFSRRGLGSVCFTKYLITSKRCEFFANLVTCFYFGVTGVWRYSLRERRTDLQRRGAFPTDSHRRLPEPHPLLPPLPAPGPNPPEPDPFPPLVPGRLIAAARLPVFSQCRRCCWCCWRPRGGGGGLRRGKQRICEQQLRRGGYDPQAREGNQWINPG